MKQTAHSKLIKQGLKILKKRPLVSAPLADLFRRLGNYKTAIQLSQYGIKKNPQFVTGHTVLGRTLFECNQYEKAQSAFEEAIKLNPENIMALRYLIKIHLRLKNIKKAVKIYEILQLYHPDDEWVEKIMKQINTHEDYNDFHVENLNEFSINLSRVEVEKRPFIRPKTEINP